MQRSNSHRSIFRRITCTIFFILFLLPLSGHTHDDDKLFTAAFIYNFIKFTNWPDIKWEQEAPTIKLCTIGHDELTHHLEDLNGRKIRSKTLTTKNIAPTDLYKCHLLYIAQSEKKNYKSFLQKIQNSPILTVAHFDNFSHNGGMIELKKVSGQTKLTINIGSTKKSGLEISSRLLILANVINMEANQ